jgi:hypothetical protein
MKKILFIFLSFYCGQLKAQVFNSWNELDYKKYYPFYSDSEIVDSFVTENLFEYLSKIDTTNSIIYKRINSENNVRIYKISRDTIKSFYYSFKRKEFTSLEVYVYNKNNLIEFYFDCTDYYFDEKRIPVSATKFFYNINNELVAKNNYYLQYYQSVINETSSFKIKDFKLTSSMTYTRKKTNSKTYIYGKENIGSANFRSKDTLIINNKGLITKFNSYADNKSLGCPMGLYVNDICEYVYKNDSVDLINKQIHCEFPGAIKKCEIFAEPYVTINTRSFSAYKFNYLLCIKLRNNIKETNNYVVK